ncbi:MAG: Glycine cleavage system H protein [Chlamydiales bacterium]|nr:Glycine cleavage system H protein [Chlamydiales bacterium]
MKYTESHEWVRLGATLATVGITDYAQKELGDIVYVELPTVGHPVAAGDEVVVLESTKAAVDIYTPVSGEIAEVNTSLREFPEKVNGSAESEGWLFKIKLSQPEQLEAFLDEKGYHKHLKSETVE